LDDVKVDTEATRLGSRALLYSSCLTLLTNFVAPLFITKSSRSTVELEAGRVGFMDLVMRKCSIELPMLWAISHGLFAMCMFATFFVSSIGGSTALITITGFSWAIALWAPFSLLGEAILSDVSSVNDDDEGEGIQLTDTRTSERVIFLADDENDEHIFEDEASQHLVQSIDIEERDQMQTGPQGLGAKAGVILGLHNVFIVIPQFLVTGLASIIFALLDPTKSVIHHPSANSDVNVGTTARQDAGVGETNGSRNGWNSVAVIFRIGGVAATVAFVLSLKLARELRKR